MTTIYLHNLMASPLFWGVFWSIFLFLICFLCVHTVRLLQFGWKYQKQQKQELAVSQTPNQTEKKQEEKPADTPPKEIYYIVERKRKAPPYSNPKRISFK